MKKPLLIGGGIVAAAVAVVLAVIVIRKDIGFLIKQGIEDKGSSMLGVSVTVEKVEMPMSTGIGKMEHLQIANYEGLTSDYFFKVDAVDIEIDTQSIETEKVRIKKLVINAPHIVFEGDIADNNLKQLQENIQNNKQDNEEKPQEKKKVQVDYFKVQNAKVYVLLKGMDKKEFILKDIELKNIGKGDQVDMQGLAQQLIQELGQEIVAHVKENIIKDLPKPPFGKNKPPFPPKPPKKPKGFPPFGK